MIVIWRPWREHLRDWIADYGHEMRDTPTVANLIAGWNELIAPRFRDQLPALGVPVELVDGSTTDYRNMTWDQVEQAA